MFGPAGNRFWRGVREPWELMGRMRQDRRLWSRYWRTVLVQAALTLVTGLAVFWMVKHGADAWQDAFGPQEPAEAVATETAGSSEKSATAPAPSAVPGSPPTRAAKPGSKKTSPPAVAPVAPSVPAAPSSAPSGEGAPSGAVGPGAAAGQSAKTSAGPADRPEADPAATDGKEAHSSKEAAARTSPPPSDTQANKEKDDDEDEESSGESETADTSLEKETEAVKNAPPEERGKRIAELVAAAVKKAKDEAARAKRHGGKESQPKDVSAAMEKVQKELARVGHKGNGADEASDLADERESVSDTLEELAIESEALALHPPDTVGESRRARQDIERKLKEAEKDAARLQRRGAAALTPEERARIDRIRLELTRVQRHERGLAGRLRAILTLLGVIWGSLATAQTIVLALSRDFHDVLSRDLSLLVHVAPEDPPMRPKVRLDLPWVRRKAKRRAWFFLGLLPGTALIYLVTRLVPFQDKAFYVLTALWAAYWWMVMTAGQSARAWSPPETTPRPWYLRAWFKATEGVILLRVFRWWGRIWERFARRFYGPSERVEEQPLEFAGLSLSRALVLVPVVKLLLRPVFPVCAAHLLVEHASTARLAIPVTSSEVAAAAARAPDAEARAHSGVATRSA